MKQKLKKRRYTKLFEWQEKAKAGGRCGVCGRVWPMLTVDHRIPQSILQQLDLLDECYEWEENFVLMCSYCNTMKGGRIDLRDGVSFRLLKEAVAKAEAKMSETNVTEPISHDKPK